VHDETMCYSARVGVKTLKITLKTAKFPSAPNSVCKSY
jgi:hypothetical protein